MFISLFVLFMPSRHGCYIIEVPTRIPRYSILESPIILDFGLNEFSMMEITMHALKQQPNRREVRVANSTSVLHYAHMYT